jgi:hypothetical protein
LANPLFVFFGQHILIIGQRLNLTAMIFSKALGAGIPIPALRKERAERSTHSINDASKIKSLGHPTFISDHMEVLYDLDVEARQLCDALALPMTRAKTVGVHPKFVAMIRELILERINPQAERRAVGMLGPRLDVCAEDCCPSAVVRGQ